MSTIDALGSDKYHLWNTGSFTIEFMNTRISKTQLITI
jgi:hypothetical protein